MKKILLFISLIMAASGVLAEACTYREAIMAMEQGNMVRGMTLMRMAQRDGDKRASQFLAAKDFQLKTGTLDSGQSDNSLVSFRQNKP